MTPLLILDLVGLSPALLEHAPHLRALAREGELRPLAGVLPAVTCSAQATMVTGAPVREHGIVANGWYFRDLAQVWLWRQSDHLMRGEKLWEAARQRHPGLRTARLFWWFNMYSSAEIAVTPRPAYPADGRKIPDIYTAPPALHAALEEELGPFPLFHFWGPGADIRSTRWIVDAARHVLDGERPELLMVYLPHLDYPLQRLGPADARIPAEVAALDAQAARLIEPARERGYAISAVSEYGVAAVRGGVHINRALRWAGLLRVQRNACGELLDAGASRAFAVADHQLAHIYVRAPSDLPAVAELLASLEGVEQILDGPAKAAAGLDHERSGELIALAAPDRWFTYYYWLDDGAAPDFARTVDIHRKPGYDPVELFLDPALRFPRLKIAAKLLRKKLGLRYLMDVIPLDDTLVKGSHGLHPASPEEGPLWLGWSPRALPPVPADLAMTDLKALWLAMLEGR